GGTGVAAASAPDQAVAYQIAPTHDGNAANAGILAPLAQAWSVALPAASSYPLIVNGMVFVTAADKTLYALNQATGQTVWSHAIGGTYPWSGLAYDRGQVFALNTDGILTAFDAAAGSIRWSRQLPGQYSFTSAPTATDGIVYVGGAGSGGTLYAVHAVDGHLLWSQPVTNGDESSPAVDAQAVYVTYVCQQDYAFARVSGAPLWHHSTGCEGGGGKTPVVGGGSVFARDSPSGNVILSTTAGAGLGPFNAGPAPALAGGVLFALNGTTLTAVAGAGLGTNSWQFTGDGQLDSAPVVVGNLVFVGSASGELYARDAATGADVWSTNVGSAIVGPDEQNVAGPLTGLAAANGTLVVAAGSQLVAYRTAGAITQVPATQAPPTIDGTGDTDQALAADVGVWSGLPQQYAYQWQLCDGQGAGCADIGAATGPTFTPTAASIGSTLRVAITATNAVGSSTRAVSAPSPPVVQAVPTNLTAPSISGIAEETRTLTADPGTWSGAPTAFAYQWLRCAAFTPCEAIATATMSTYVQTAADVGATIEVQVVASNARGSSDPALSAPTSAVAMGPPVNQTLPSFTGDPQDGQTLTANPGTWSGNPTRFSYQWYTCDPAGSDCPDLPGATQQTYVVRPADIGQFLGVTVVATNAAGDSAPADSDAFGPVLPKAPTITSAPIVSGSAQQGQTLSATPGGWLGSPTAYDYQWVSCDPGLTACTAIPGATASTYVVAAADVGRRLLIDVVASNAGGPSADDNISDPTATVIGLPPPPPGVAANLVAPSIAGTAQAGQTLTAGVGTWTNSPSAYAYQWERCATPTSCTGVAGATAATYPLTAADVGQRVAVEVVAVNAGGRSGPASSVPTAVVIPARSSAFTMLTRTVRPDGSLAISAQVENAGRFTAVAATSVASLASVRTAAKPARTATYGRGSLTVTAPAKVLLVIKPSKRAQRAIAKRRVLHVTVTITFQSAQGGPPTTQIHP
ncbi:MAG TPA: PQQ-binding-like beta-propeller repeat protein, partial [Solirubrobacteraceae bacterium]|nr:PQQ-binding-like beta-propeller repeat protein [Solirubrobacteraceae bacterium]